ncbi:MAG TPA: heparinase II/III family protein, partial [Kribbellaceae bacterium]|nr:heparinase II/III family protein [Kribbellaceae bacterium]
APCRYGCRLDTAEVQGAWTALAHQACARRILLLAESVVAADNYQALRYLLAATRPDGWQWEASTYYHTFVLRAAVLALRAVPAAPPPAAVRDRLAGMAGVLATLRTSGGLLPALHDGPYARQGFVDELTDLEEAVDGSPAPPEEIHVFADAGYAVVRGHGIHAIVDFGPHGGSHGHRDKLALYLYGAGTAWNPDPGQVPYGHAGWRRYYAGTAAHPAYSVDGEEQAECGGRLVEVTDRSITVACDDAYPGVPARRRLTLGDTGLLDELSVDCDRPRRITSQLRPAVALDAITTGMDWTAYDTTTATFRSEYRTTSRTEN